MDCGVKRTLHSPSLRASSRLTQIRGSALQSWSLGISWLTTPIFEDHASQLLMMGFFSRPKNEDLTTVSEHLDVVPSNEDEKTGDVQLEAAHGSGLVLTPDMERSLVRKMDRRLIPILWVLCMSP